MIKKCIYCKCTLHEDTVFDVCQSCGFKVWGEKMYNAIVQNMSNAKEAGDLYQGSITLSNEKDFSQIKKSKPELDSITREAIANKENHEIKFENPSELKSPASPVLSASTPSAPSTPTAEELLIQDEKNW